MNISVYDDNVPERKMIICHIKSYYYGRYPPVTISEFAADDCKAENGEASVPDIALICQNGGKGAQTARRIRTFCSTCALVMISDTPQYSIEAYNLRAAHYLVKPVGYSQLCEALTRCEKQKEPKNSSTLWG